MYSKTVLKQFLHFISKSIYDWNIMLCICPFFRLFSCLDAPHPHFAPSISRARIPEGTVTAAL